MKTLVVYYSRTGTTKRMALEIARKLKADVDEILSEDYSGSWGYLSGSLQALFKTKPKIRFNKNPGDYDRVIVGSPIWAGTFVPPVRSYLSINMNKLNKFIFFCSSGGGNIANARNQLKILNPKTIFSLTTKEVKNDRYYAKLESFVKEVKKQDEKIKKK